MYRVGLSRENKKRDLRERDEIIKGIDNPNGDAINGVYDSVEAARIDKGDEWSGFRYSL